MPPILDCDTCREATRDLAREYQELVDSLDDIVFRFDEHGRWTYLSPAWTRRLGWAVTDGIGRAAAKFIHRGDRKEVLRNWHLVLAGQGIAYRGEVRLLETSGGYRWMLASARGLRDAHGRLRGVTGTFTDVSAAKAVEAELIAARTAAEAANKAKSEFLSTMSHELRTPLNAVIGLTESLLETGAPFDADRTKRYLGIIHGSGRQLLSQINDILDLARIEAGRIKVASEDFDLRSVCAGAIESAQRDIRAKQLRTESDLPTTPFLVRADERLLRQAVQNLVSNAVKFTPKGGRVTVRLEQLASGQITIAVSDTGIGIEPAKLSLLFKPFSQVDSSLARQFGGTGLGLALVDRLTRLHGGTVTVQSTPAVGSTFVIELPAALRLRPNRPRRPAGPRSRRILLVDDDPHQHTLLGDYLRRHGFELAHCDSAHAALERVSLFEPALAIVDINMPGMNGLALIAELRRLPIGRELRVMAVTALAEAEAAEQCRAAGADAHLAKPVSLTLLLQRIQTFLSPDA